MIVLPLVCCDLILGIQWLKSLGQILWDFDKLKMEFTTNGRKFVLRGAKTPSFKFINNKSFAQAINKGVELCFLSTTTEAYSFEMPTCHAMKSAEQTCSLPDSSTYLINQYDDIFDKPTASPSTPHGFGHKISMKKGTQPFNLQPYRFSVVQKDVIDNIVQEMLDQGIV